MNNGELNESLPLLGSRSNITSSAWRLPNVNKVLLSLDERDRLREVFKKLKDQAYIFDMLSQRLELLGVMIVGSDGRPIANGPYSVEYIARYTHSNRRLGQIPVPNQTSVDTGVYYSPRNLASQFVPSSTIPNQDGMINVNSSFYHLMENAGNPNSLLSKEDVALLLKFLRSCDIKANTVEDFGTSQETIVGRYFKRVEAKFSKGDGIQPAMLGKRLMLLGLILAQLVMIVLITYTMLYLPMTFTPTSGQEYKNYYSKLSPKECVHLKAALNGNWSDIGAPTKEIIREITASPTVGLLHNQVIFASMPDIFAKQNGLLGMIITLCGLWILGLLPNCLLSKHHAQGKILLPSHRFARGFAGTVAIIALLFALLIVHGTTRKQWYAIGSAAEDACTQGHAHDITKNVSFWQNVVWQYALLGIHFALTLLNIFTYSSDWGLDLLTLHDTYKCEEAEKVEKAMQEVLNPPPQAFRSLMTEMTEYDTTDSGHSSPATGNTPTKLAEEMEEIAITPSSQLLSPPTRLRAISPGVISMTGSEQSETVFLRTSSNKVTDENYDEGCGGEIPSEDTPYFV